MKISFLIIRLFRVSLRTHCVPPQIILCRVSQELRYARLSKIKIDTRQDVEKERRSAQYRGDGPELTKGSFPLDSAKSVPLVFPGISRWIKARFKVVPPWH